MTFRKVNAQMLLGLPARAHESSGAGLKKRIITLETLAADVAGDVLALCKVGAHEIPVRIEIVNDAIAGATDVELGLYRDTEVAVDIDCLMGTTDISAGIAWASRTDGLSALGVEARGIKSFAEIAGDSIGDIPNDSYVLCLTLNSEVTAAGTITLHIETVDQQ